METNAKTWAAFNRHRKAEVPKGSTRFLLDYHNARGDLTDTVRLDAAAFEAITGEKIKTDAEYHRIDEKYWRDARAAYERQACSLGRNNPIL